MSLKNKLRKMVKDELKSKDYYKAADDQLYETAKVEFEKALANGKSEKEALRIAKKSCRANLNMMFPEKTLSVYRFAFISSLMVFAISLIIMILGLSFYDVSVELFVIYILFVLFGFFLFIYTIATFKQRSWLDIAVVVLLFSAIIAIHIQSYKYNLLSYNGEYYYALHYIFPGLLRRDLMVIIDPYVIPHMYEVKGSFYFFDPTLVVSFVCLVTSSIFIIKERYDRKKLEIEKENS